MNKLLATHNNLRTAAALSLAGAALAGCSSVGNFDAPVREAETFTVESATIMKTPREDTAALNIRYDDEAYDTSGIGNICAQLDRFDDSISLGSMTLSLSIGDMNGSRVGVPLESMPENIQDSCREDKDGTVWVLADHVITKPPMPDWVHA